MRLGLPLPERGTFVFSTLYLLIRQGVQSLMLIYGIKDQLISSCLTNDTRGTIFRVLKYYLAIFWLACPAVPRLLHSNFNEGYQQVPWIFANAILWLL